MVRMTKYKTKLTEDKRVTLEKEISVNRPDMVSIIRSPEDAVNVGKGFLRVHEESVLTNINTGDILYTR